MFRKFKRRKKQKQERFERLKRKLEHGPFRPDKLIIEPKGQVKMSKVLADFVEPYKKFADTEEAYRKLLTLAIIVWNASFLSEKDQQDKIQSVLDKGMPTGIEELKASLKEIVYALLVRKKMYFSKYTRRIIDFELTDTGKEYRITVASTL